MKTCAEVQKEINELRKKLKRDKRNYDTYKHLSEQQRCDSESPLLMCEKCDCWKSAREYCS